MKEEKKTAKPGVSLPRSTVKSKAAQEARVTEEAEITIPNPSQKAVDSEKKTDEVIPQKSRVTPKKPKTASATASAKAPGKTVRKSTVPVSVKKKKTTESLQNNDTSAIDDQLEEVLDGETAEEIVIEEVPVDLPEENPEPTKKLSIFERRLLHKKKHDEQNLSVLELIRQKSGFSEDDLALIFELGYEHDLGRLVGYENLKKLKSDYLRRAKHVDNDYYRTAFGYRGADGAENPSIVAAAYLKDRKNLIWRMLLTLLISVFLFLIEIPLPILAPLNHLIAAYALWLKPLGLILFGICAALSYRQLFAGAKSLFVFSPTPYSLLTAVTPFVLLYDVASFFFTSEMVRVNFPASLLFLMLALCDVLRLASEMRTLQIIHAEGIKTVLATSTPRKKMLRRGNKIVRIINEESTQNLYQVQQAELIVGSLRRFNDMQSASRIFGILIFSMFALSVFAAFAIAVVTASLLQALMTFITVLAVASPLGALFGYFYPLCCANRILAKRNTALIGEEAVAEYQENKTVIFSDSQLFSTKDSSQISIREGEDLRVDLRLAAVLFRKLGGALENVSAAARKTDDIPVSIIRVLETGVEAMVDGRYHLLAGSAQFMRKNDIRIPVENSDDALRRNNATALMYVAVDGILKLSYEIEYQTDASFEAVIRRLADCNTSVSIHSYDPNLNAEFLQKCRPHTAEPVGVVKPGRYEGTKPLDITDTGAVALGSPNDIVYPLYAAASIRTVRRFVTRISLIAALIGAVGVTALTLLNLFQPISTLAIVLYQLVWLPVVMIATHSELNSDKLNLKK